MYELIQAGPRSFYINSPVRIGVYLINGEKVYLIDSSSGKDVGRKMCQILKREGWSLHTIINTHSNVNRIGGNKYLIQQTGCRIYASSMEIAFTRHPILGPTFLYGGYPFKNLRHRFLMAQENDVSDVSRLPEDQLLEDLELIPLPGHFFQMTDIRTPDDTVSLADCLSSRTTLEKYGVSFIYDVAIYLGTLDRVASMRANLFAPAYAGVSYNVATLVSHNRGCVMGIRELLLELCRIPKTSEALLKEVFGRYGLVMTFQQYVLVGSTIRSYLSQFEDMGEMKAYIEENCPYWRN